MSRWPLVLLVPLLALTACGGSEDDGPSTTPDPTVVTTPTDDSPEPSDPTLTGKPAGAAQTLTGSVAAGDENGCLVLTATQGQRGSWQLVGSTAGIAPGTQVTVRGRPAPDLATRCQQGTPFVVEAVEPG
jgi:hypothetical protein